MSDRNICFVCQKHRGREFVPGGPIYEDDLVFSGHSWSVSEKETPYLGGLIVEPKRHLPSWAELTTIEAERIGRVIRDVSLALKESEKAGHIYVFVLGHHVPHLHIWVIPRYPDTPHEFWGFNLFDWPERPVGGTAEVEEICARLRSVMR